MSCPHKVDVLRTEAALWPALKRHLKADTNERFSLESAAVSKSFDNDLEILVDFNGFLVTATVFVVITDDI